MLSLERQIPFTCSIGSTTNNLLSSCTSGKSHKLHTFFDLKFSLSCVSLELRCEMTRLDQKIWFIHLSVFQLKPPWFNELFCICNNTGTV